MSAKALMIQGTMSNSGKSFITAGLCRIFKQDGYKVAPFKSQNMALNSYITKDRLEIGRAQAMQAEAAGIEPTVDMNPILLKPTSHTGSQVIVNGEVWADMKAMDYYKNKKALIPEVMKAYNKLASEYDIIVIEGAGSPAEINLKDNDIVNMGMAKMAKAPVLLAADIDRGGVFASIYGTIKLLDADEQQMIKGTIINKFRGDVKILEPGLRQIEALTDIPVVGVIPMAHVDIDDEDSLSERLNMTAVSGGVDIAVIRLPHISNFTDFSAFERMPNVSLRYVQKKEQLGMPDMIILPGTKNTMDDLTWLRESGLEGTILRHAEMKVPVVGICGGYQMMGTELTDPDNVEHGGTMRGMGLLNTKTIFVTSKTRTQIHGKVHSCAGYFEKMNGMAVTGYEIHMGRTQNLGGCVQCVELEDGRTDALMNAEGTVFGSYLHGLFDSEGVASAMVAKLFKKKGIDPEDEPFDLQTYKEKQYDALADVVRNALDMQKVYEILNRGV